MLITLDSWELFFYAATGLQSYAHIDYVCVYGATCRALFLHDYLEMLLRPGFDTVFIFEDVSLAPQFIRYTVNCISRDSVSHLLTHLVVYIIARCSSLNTTTFCLFPVCPVLPHPTEELLGRRHLHLCAFILAFTRTMIMGSTRLAKVGKALHGVDVIYLRSGSKTQRHELRRKPCD